MSFIGNILNNLLGYDLLIILLAVVNTLLYLKLDKRASNLFKTMHRTLSVPLREIFAELVSKEKEKMNLARLENIQIERAELVSLYSLFTTIISIFPLMGILGTVISLLRSMGMADPDMSYGLSTALTSTFWGLVFAIAFKFLDGRVSPKIDTASEQLNMLVTRLDKYQQTAGEEDD